MKTFKFIILGIIAALALVSCDIPIGLGSKLDLEGPVLNFTSPVPRKAVKTSFDLEGTVSDNSGIGKLLIKVEQNKEPFPRQWRNTGGKWEISNDYGANWASFSGAKWNGDKSVVWSIPVDMKVNNAEPDDGQYMFIAQAWDVAEMSDDNSFKTLILIVDHDPPVVSISKPLLYDRHLESDYNKVTDEFDTLTDDGKELQALRVLTDWKKPDLIGKFQTNSFELQWSIEENFNIWAFDLRFYEMGVDGIDENGDTDLPDDYVYRYYKNDFVVPENPSPSDYVKPNGKVTVPALDGPIGNFGANGELKKSLSKDNTTLRVVAVCKDTATNVTKEKILGYFIYWANADIPWITFSGAITPPESYNGVGTFPVNADNKAFLVYPGVFIKAVAFHAQGVKSVTYSIKKLDEPLKDPYSSNTSTSLVTNETLINDQPSRGKFDWEFLPEPRSGYYVVSATTLSASDKTSDEVVGIFKVQDITFPDIKSVKPDAMKPLFEAVESTDSITISGIVDDATKIETLCLVWINPQSKGFAAQNQLEYFRDAAYVGWKTALGLTAGGAFAVQNDHDPANPNKVWKLNVTKSTDHTNGINPETQRVEYKFSRNIPLSQLNIGTNQYPDGTEQALKSQVFLLRVANDLEVSKPKVTIRTYTPQGDEAPPVIKITNAVITRTAGGPETHTPGNGLEVEKFVAGDKIAINGTWEEDSIEYLDFTKYLRPNFKISINGISVPLANITFSAANKVTSGTWSATLTVGTAPGNIPVGNLKDTLVVSANLRDIGGNQSDDGASWLVVSDTLRLVRISSDNADQAYKVGDKIKIFLEFNKPVLLKSGRANNPVLTLRVGGTNTITAAYDTETPQTAQSTKQYFLYTVATGQNTNATYPWLDVTDINGTFNGNYWEAANYPFTWVATQGTNSEEIRITRNAAHTEANNSVYGAVLLRRLPVSTNTSDLPYTLARGKNISIDTTAPTVSSIRTTNKAGHYPLGSVIDIIVKFSEPVKLASATLPQLRLLVANTGATPTTVLTTATEGSVRVNNDEVSFSYTVNVGDTTNEAKVIVDVFVNSTSITDIAGTTMATMTLTEANRTLNGGTANNGTGVYINTIAPGVPVFKALSNTTVTISNTVNGSAVTGESTTAVKDLKNYYGDELYFSITGNSTGGANRLGSLEYSLDNGTNWKRIDSTTGAPFKQDIYGNYSVITRQIDKAGNISEASKAVSLNWDPGTLVTRIDSSSPNGTYTRNTVRTDSINVTVYFRKTLTFTETPRITLNTIRGAATGVNINGAAGSGVQLSFTYDVAANDNTPAGTGRAQYLDVTALTITATDSDGVAVNNFIQLPTDNDNKLGYRKDILVQTGALALASGTNPVYAITAANDEAMGTITFTFNRSISKRTGSVTVIQQNTGYRLPAVLTETQANRYKNAVGFNTYYSRGTNGFANNAVDTVTKYVLNYAQTTVVTPNNTSGIDKLAYDFLQAEIVTLPVSSQDIKVDGNKLTITLTGSNALQVLGASYDIGIPAGLVQDGLSFQWPGNNTTYNHTTAGINRPFVRIDKRINEDRITRATNGSMTVPYLRSDFSRVLQTTVRMDCRTPNSIVRYSILDEEHTATQSTTDFNRSGTNWRNGGALNTNPQNNDKADRYDFLTQPSLSETGAAGTAAATPTGYATDTTSLTVGNNAESGYIWRVSVRSRNGTGGSTNSAIYEEIAFRTVLTYQLTSNNANGEGQALDTGDQLWIRGGDAIGSSSVPGFPINWQDDYGKLNSDDKRAGIRLLRRIETNANLNTASSWRWITWEINVRTWHDVILGRGTDVNTAQQANDAWQYGPRQWAYKRGGWAALKDDYTLYPGKHRWCTISGSDYQPGGRVNFSLQFSTRSVQDVSFSQPNP
jgi:hypothetical protein